MMTNNPILDEPIEEINVPILKPYQGKKMIKLYEKEAPLKGFLKTYRINDQEGQDQTIFINHVRHNVIKFLFERRKPFQVKFIFTCKFQKGVSEEEMTYNEGYFHTNIERIMEDTNLGKLYERMTRECLEKIEKFQNRGSGWQFKEVVSFDINVDPSKPLGGSSYFPTPKKLDVKKAIINVQNKQDNECFKWAVTSAVFPREKNKQRLNQEMRVNSEKLNWEGIDFPTPIYQIARFEKQNPYSINVFGYTGERVYPLRISEHENKQCINMILFLNKKNKHYCWIADMSRLTASQINKHKGKRHVCKHCCNSFQKEVSLQNHIEYCRKHKAVGVVMPKKGTMLSLKNYYRKMRVPFVVYADFEAFTNPISTCSQSDDKSYTKSYQVHNPCGFSYYIKCFDDGLFPPVLKYFTIENKDDNVGEVFVKRLEEDIVDIYNEFKFKKNIKITRKEELDFQKATVCHICENPLNNDKVRDHCHLTGRYRGAAHRQCNLKYKLPSFYPVIFHNLSGYDAHMFIKDLAKVVDPLVDVRLTKTQGGIKCIAKTEENYISFSKTIVVDVYEKDGKKVEIKRNIRFLDSFKFMGSSLSKLASNLTDHPNLQRYFNDEQLELVKRKGVYPYDYMDCFEKLAETSLPSKDDFYSKLNDEDISTGEYNHAKKVWNEFQMKTMRNYHDLYLKTGVLLLADVFEEFRNICLKNYKLDPAWYLTTPGFAWEACLKMTKVNLELLHDQDMLLMVEKGTRGGVSMISTRQGIANNKYMEGFNSSLPSKYIAYLDANNLYGCWGGSRIL